MKITRSTSTTYDSDAQETVTETTIHGEVTAKDLLEFVASRLTFPSGSVVSFHVDVPSGGDWSGMSLEIGPEHALKFEALTTQTERTPPAQPPEPVMPPLSQRFMRPTRPGRP